MLIQIQILPFWFVQSRNVSTVLTITHRVMYGSKLYFIPTPPFPTKVRNWANLGPCQIQLIQSKVRNNNVTSPSPICPCCMSNEEKKKKNNLSNIVKRINCDFISQFLKLEKFGSFSFPSKYLKKKKKKGIWMVRGQFNVSPSFLPSFLYFFLKFFKDTVRLY